MRISRAGFVLAIVGAGLGVYAALPTSTAGAQKPESADIEIAGRKLRCDRVEVVLDRRLPSEGAAAPGVLILNPRMLNHQPAAVRLFVFHHECGHHRVGDSELKADCWAVERGVREGWLDASGLDEVCLSFEDAPETPSHPSARRRCRNLEQCFTGAVAALAQRTPIPAASTGPGKRQALAAAVPKLVKGPTLMATGRLRYGGGGPCPEPRHDRTVDAIGKMLAKDPTTASGCY